MVGEAAVAVVRALVRSHHERRAGDGGHGRPPTVRARRHSARRAGDTDGRAGDARTVRLTGGTERGCQGRGMAMPAARSAPAIARRFFVMAEYPCGVEGTAPPNAANGSVKETERDRGERGRGPDRMPVRLWDGSLSGGRGHSELHGCRPGVRPGHDAFVARGDHVGRRCRPSVSEDRDG